jgi:tRNA nucleotidyltransferase (CCA-adding enzyme)
MSHLHEVTDRGVRRLAKRLEPENILDLCIVMTADAFGRPPKPKKVPRVVEALQAKAAELKVQSDAPKPILLGRHLIQLGMAAGPDMGVVLNKAYDAQIEGKFFTLAEAMEWLAREVATQWPDLATAARKGPF